MTDSTVPAQPSAPSFPDLESTPANPQEARAALEQLRSERMAGRVDQHRYIERAEYLQRVIVGEQIAAPNLYPTMEERLAQHYDEAMKAPTELHQYGHLPAMSEDPDLAQQLDTAARAAFVKAGIPVHLGAPIVEAAVRMSRELAGLSRQELETRMRSTMQRLADRWGEQYEARYNGILDIVDEMAEAHPAIGRLIDTAPHLIFASEAAVEYLGRVADHRARKRA